MENVKLRPCGECTACCDGQLISKSYGNEFGQGQKCIFLVKKKCTIYETRPQVCRNYQCAWTQYLLDEDMRPDKCGLMVSVEINNNVQYLKAIEIWKNVPFESYEKLEKCANKLNTKWVKVSYHEHNIHNQRRCGSGHCGNPCS